MSPGSPLRGPSPLRTSLARVAAGLALLLGASACSTPADDQRINAALLDPGTFPQVSSVLLRRCGSLDCHGSPFRNFRLVGFGGTRLGADRPGGGPTTDAEHAYNYQGLVALEPEKLADVAASKGARVSELTLLRKARGEENHKGDQRIVPGDAADKCLVTWLSGASDPASCKAATDAP